MPYFLLGAALGVVIGLVLAVLVVAVLAYFRKAVEKTVQIIETKLAAAGPQPRGFVFEPEDEAETARQEIIDRNRQDGRDTPISELM